jgi:dihydroorotate dehydrogenase
MGFLENTGLKLLRLSKPELAHNIAIKALNLGLAPKPEVSIFENLKTSICGLKLDNPIGLAAGFDKNAEAVDPLLKCGFGFIEVGAITPEPQPGNPKPRLFRLPKDQAVINRFGFNNLGMEMASVRLARRSSKGVVGINLGANKNSKDRIEDYAKVLKCCGPFVNFATINISSPNTENLRNLQEKNSLKNLLDQVLECRDNLKNKIPIFLKIAPDLSLNQIDDISEIALKMEIDAIVATNTTLDRRGIKSRVKNEKGGLSGKPLFSKSTWVLAHLSQRLDNKIPLIGVGGVASATDAYQKLLAGATAVQLYTGLVYHGIGLVSEINKGLSEILSNQGIDHVSKVVGKERDNFL